MGVEICGVVWLGYSTDVTKVELEYPFHVDVDVVVAGLPCPRSISVTIAVTTLFDVLTGGPAGRPPPGIPGITGAGAGAGSGSGSGSCSSGAGVSCMGSPRSIF